MPLHALTCAFRTSDVAHSLIDAVAQVYGKPLRAFLALVIEKSHGQPTFPRERGPGVTGRCSEGCRFDDGTRGALPWSRPCRRRRRYGRMPWRRSALRAVATAGNKKGA